MGILLKVFHPALEACQRQQETNWLLKSDRNALKGAALIYSLWWPVTGPKGMAWSCIREGSGWMLGKKVLHWQGGQVLEQASQGSGHSTEPAGVWEAFRQCFLDMVSFFGWCYMEPGVGRVGPFHLMILWSYLCYKRSLPSLQCTFH